MRKEIERGKEKKEITRGICNEKEKKSGKEKKEAREKKWQESKKWDGNKKLEEIEREI